MRADTDTDLDAFERQRLELRRHGRLRWVHWAIIGGSMLVTVVAWHVSDSLVEQRDQQRFEREIGRVVDLVHERLDLYENALLSGVASIQASNGEVSREQWRLYTDHLRLTEHYPGVSGVGVIFHLDGEEVEEFLVRARQERPDFRIHPAHEFDFRLPITYVEPELDNAAAVGLDVAFELNRRAAALDARRTGMTRISGPIVLVQDTGRTPGFLFYAPYYDTFDKPTSLDGVSPEEREAAFLGFVYAPLVVRNLIAGTLDSESRDVHFSIRDGADVLYDERGSMPAVAPGTRTGTRSVDFYGRTWTFEFHGVAAADTVGPSLTTMVLLSGLAMEAMLIGLFIAMSRSNRRALALAEETTNGLASHARRLSATNEELSSYAHVVSHDLKSPIRGIQDVATFLREDLEDYLDSGEANPEVALNLDRLERQASKGQTLIRGILDYSSVGVHDEQLSRVDVGALVADIGLSLGVQPGQLRSEGELPVFETHAVRLGQVFENLIGNAFKYHHDPGHALVRVSAERDGARYRFAVSDNGPGIEPQYHARIFETFARLELAEDASSSGIGLSIVRKSVELLGGRVEVDSAKGRGTTMRFDWPAEALQRAA